MPRPTRIIKRSAAGKRLREERRRKVVMTQCSPDSEGTPMDCNDLLRNLAGLDDSNLYISSHAVLVEAVKEWREEARRLLASPSPRAHSPKKPPVFPASLEKVFEDHYWDTFQNDRNLIMKHVHAVLRQYEISVAMARAYLPKAPPRAPAQCACGRPLECPECMSLRTEPQASQIVAWCWRLKGNTDWWVGETVPTAISGNGNWQIEPLGFIQVRALALPSQPQE